MTQEGDTLTLTVKEVFPDDAGMYSVKASNSEGDCTTVCRLHVLGGYNSSSPSGSTGSSRTVRSRTRRMVQTETTRQHIIRQVSSPSFVVSRREQTVTNGQTIPVTYSRSSSVDSRVSGGSTNHVRSQSVDRLQSRVQSGMKDGEYVVNIDIKF